MSENAFECESEEEIETVLSPLDRVAEQANAHRAEQIADAEDCTVVNKPRAYTYSRIENMVKEHIANKLHGGKQRKVLFLKKGDKVIAYFPEIKGRDEEFCGACTDEGFCDRNIEQEYPESEVVDSLDGTENTTVLKEILSQYNLRRVLSYSAFQQNYRWSKFG